MVHTVAFMQRACGPPPNSPVLLCAPGFFGFKGMGTYHITIIWISGSWLWVVPVIWFLLTVIISGKIAGDTSRYGPADAFFANALPVPLVAILTGIGLLFLAMIIHYGLNFFGYDLGFVG